jgi:tetratricopeptide (TPR) repeat protein
MYATCKILTGDAEISIPLLEKLLADNSKYPQALLLLAEAFLCMNKKEKGLEYIEKFETESKVKCTALLNTFARMLVTAKRREYALSLLKIAIETNKRTDETMLLLEECSQLQKGT